MTSTVFPRPPIPVRMLNGAARFLHRFGFDVPTLDAESLIRKAVGQTPVEPDPAVREATKQIVLAAQSQPRLRSLDSLAILTTLRRFPMMPRSGIGAQT